MVTDILERQEQNLLISQKQETEQHRRTVLQEQKKKVNIAALGHQKCSCSKSGTCSFDHDPANIGTGKGHRSRSLVLRDNSAERQHARKSRKSLPGKEDRLPCFNYKRGSCSHDRVCEYWPPPQCKHFKIDRCPMRKDCPFIHSQRQGRSGSPRRNGKGKEKMSEKEKGTIAVVMRTTHGSSCKLKLP